MIRRISKNNDLKDLIKSCPSGVIDDIYKIEYYIQGYNLYIEATFSKVGKLLEVILPTTDLQTLPNGILMRKAYYKVADPSYPDGYYNLEFEDNMNIWLGENEGETPIIPEYVTEQELSQTLSSYTTQSWISSQDYATESWVSGQGYLTSVPSGYATESWVSSQQFITSAALTGYATESWVHNQGYLTSVPSGYATKSWVSEQGYLTSVPSGYATESWVSSQQFVTQEYVTSQISYLSEEIGLISTRVDEIEIRLPQGDYNILATQQWVSDQGYYIEDPYNSVVTEERMWYVIGGEGEDNPFVREETMYETISTQISYALSGYATESWVESQGYITSIPDTFATKDWVSDQGYITSVILEGYATESWVESQGYITSTGLSGLATQSWVSSNFLSSTALTGYATESWVSSQQFATESWVSLNFLSTTALTGYATESWVTSQLSDVVRFSDGRFGDEILVSYCAYIGTSSFGLVVDGQDDGAGLALFENNGTTPLVTTNDLDGYARESWVSSNFLSTTALNGYATQSWVESQGYLTSVPSGYATESWVTSQSYITSAALNGYATESWVSSQQFITSVALTGYATESWVTSQFFEESKIWTGTQSQWEELTPEQQVLYTIALVTE